MYVCLRWLVPRGYGLTGVSGPVVSRWSGAKDVQAVEETTARIRADLLCELAVV